MQVAQSSTCERYTSAGALETRSECCTMVEKHVLLRRATGIEEARYCVAVRVMKVEVDQKLKQYKRASTKVCQQ